MLERQPLNGLLLLGILLIVLGLILVLIPLLARLGVRLESAHPLLLWGRRFDGIYVGTSPILIIIIMAVYLLLFLLRRG